MGRLSRRKHLENGWVSFGAWMVAWLCLSPAAAAGAGPGKLPGEKPTREAGRKSDQTLEQEPSTPEEGDFPQLVEADEQDELADELAFLQEEAIVESAARHRQPIGQSASAITLLTREEIELTGARTLLEALRQVPNASVFATKPFWSEISIRGGKSTDTVLLMVDGRDATLELLGFPTWTSQHFSMDEVKRIEVIRGPGSALYGANAYSGVVSVTTYAPGEGPENLCSYRGGEHGYNELGCRVSRKLGLLAISTSAGLVREDLWTGRDIRGRSLLRGRFGGKLELRQDAELLVDAGAYRTEGRSRAGWGESEFRDLFNFTGRVGFRYQELSLQAIYDRYYIDVNLGVEVRLGETPLFRAPPLETTVDKLALISQHSLEVLHNRITYGVEYLSHQYQLSIFEPKDQGENRVGIFLQDEVDLQAIAKSLADVNLPVLILTAGLRADWNEVSNWELSPRAALVLQFFEHHSLRGGYAHAFLKPKLLEVNFNIRLDDLAVTGFDRLRFVPDSDLGNETIDSLEAGYRGSFFGGQLELGIDFAYSRYRDLIIMDVDEDLVRYIEIGTIQVPDLSGPGFIVRNYSEDDTDGYSLELQLQFRPAEGSRLFLNLGYRRLSYVRTGSPDKGEPAWHVAGGAEFALSQTVDASVQAFYRSSSHDLSPRPEGMLAGKESIDMPAYLLLNARIACRLLSKPLVLRAGLEGFNLLGNRFWEKAGKTIPNRPDFSSERLDRRVVAFLEGQI